MNIREIIVHLSEEDLQELATTLQAGILGNSKAFTRIFASCKQLSHENKDWNEADLSRRIFPEADPNTKRNYIRVRLSKLKGHILKYLSIKALVRDEILRSYCLLDEINYRGWKREFSTEFKKEIAKIDRAPLKGFSHHSVILQLKDQELGHINEGKVDWSVPLFQNSLDALDKAYVIKKLSLSCKATAQDRDNKTSHSISAVDEMVRFAKHPRFKDDALIQLYLLIYQINSEASLRSNRAYSKAKELYFELLPKIQRSGYQEAEDIFIFLVNYCITSYNQKQVAFGKELVDLYEQILGRGVIDEDGKIDPGNFKNIFSLYLYVKAYDAIDRMFERYGRHIKGDTGDAMLYFCKGHLAFIRANYEEADEHLMKAKFRLEANRDYQFDVEIRALQARVSFMLPSRLKVEVQIKALQRCIQKKSTQHPKKASFRAFGQYMKALNRACRLSGEKRKAALANLADKLNKEDKPFYAKSWIMQQIRQKKSE